MGRRGRRDAVVETGGMQREREGGGCKANGRSEKGVGEEEMDEWARGETRGGWERCESKETEMWGNGRVEGWSGPEGGRGQRVVGARG